ncbi:hypothetical protein V8G54_012613 [Vigna mungo]|uniref:Uncharacterized protein n=1 Tax=Vigna mungo TaxID=3915 RepID=A0AAQ3S2H6_VIGMU
MEENRISGQIPHQLALMRPTNINLSSNSLVGRIPSEFENLVYASSFLNNPGLCADTPVLNLILCNSRPQRAKIDRRYASHPGGSSLLAGFVVIIFDDQSLQKKKAGTEKVMEAHFLSKAQFHKRKYCVLNVRTQYYWQWWVWCSISCRCW